MVRRRPWLQAAIYLPGLLLLCLHGALFLWFQPSERLKWNMDRLEMGYLATLFVASAVILWQSYRRASYPLLRQQMKWVTRGTILAVAPFTLFNVLPFLFGALP